MRGPDIVYTMRDIEKLKDETNVGDIVKFRINDNDGYIFRDRLVKFVGGEVTAKYKYVFQIDKGRFYRWADYLIGK